MKIIYENSNNLVIRPMPYLYLLCIKNIFTNDYEKNIAVLCPQKDKELSKLEVGSLTKLFNENNRTSNRVLYKDTIEIDDMIYESIIPNIGRNSLLNVHRTKGNYYLSVDNMIWRLSSGGAGQDMIEYPIVYVY